VRDLAKIVSGHSSSTSLSRSVAEYGVSSSTAQYKTSDGAAALRRRPDLQPPSHGADRMVESTVRSCVRVRCRRWAILNLMLIENKRGNYFFLKGIAPYSAGVVAGTGFESSMRGCRALFRYGQA